MLGHNEFFTLLTILIYQILIQFQLFFLFLFQQFLVIYNMELQWLHQTLLIHYKITVFLFNDFIFVIELHVKFLIWSLLNQGMLIYFFLKSADSVNMCLISVRKVKHGICFWRFLKRFLSIFEILCYQAFISTFQSDINFVFIKLHSLLLFIKVFLENFSTVIVQIVFEIKINSVFNWIFMLVLQLNS